MHLLLNALPITNRSGTGRYTFGLIQGLLNNNLKSLRLSIILPSDFHLPRSWNHHSNTRFYSVPVKAPLKRMIWEQAALPKWVNWLKPEVLHSPAFIAPVFRSIVSPQVVTIHDLAFEKHQHKIPLTRRIFYRYVIPRSIRKAEIVITDSQTVATELELSRFTPKQVKVVPLGVDPRHFNAESHSTDLEVLKSYNLHSPFFLMVATQEPRKNITTILNAFKQLREKTPTIRIALAGRYGWMVNHHERDLAGVDRLGYVPDEHLPALYRHAAAFIAPSHYEGFDLPAAEALACGTPVLASDIPVHREVLGDLASFIPYDQPEAWLKNMYEFVTHNEKHPSRKFSRSWDEVASETYQIYKAIANKPTI